MKRYIGILILLFLMVGGLTLNAKDLLPSEIYYKENIAVNKVTTTSPSTRAPVPGGVDPGSNGPGPDGEEIGSGEHVNAPIGDAAIPILAAGLLYAFYLLHKNRRKEEAE